MYRRRIWIWNFIMLSWGWVAVCENFVHAPICILCWFNNQTYEQQNQWWIEWTSRWWACVRVCMPHNERVITFAESQTAAHSVHGEKMRMQINKLITQRTIAHRTDSRPNYASNVFHFVYKITPLYTRLPLLEQLQTRRATDTCRAFLVSNTNTHNLLFR